MFFAPNQMRKRIGEWGRDELDRRFADARRHFATVVSDWVDIVLHDGPKALEQVWLDTYAGRRDPRQGHVIAL